jgi:MFS family permease
VRKVFGDYEQEPLLGVPTSTWTARPPGPSVSLLEALREPIYRRAVVAVIAAMFAQQATGINCVIMYSVEILDAALPTGAVLVTVIVSVVNVLVTILFAPLADKIGRKPCLLLSIGGIGASSLLLAMGLIHKVPGLSVLATFLFVTSFGVGLGPVPFILASELVDSNAFGAVQSWGLTACWLANFSVAQFFPMLDAVLPTGYVFWVFVVIAIIIGSFIAWWVPESKGKTTTAEVWGDK